jgi:aspartate 1-decarboxylase
MRWVIRSKIRNATVTEANLAYVGSITIDKALIHQAGLWVGERVLVVSNTSGARLETYIIEGPEGSGSICMNGAAAHLITKGERVIIYYGFRTGLGCRQTQHDIGRSGQPICARPF